MEAAWAFEHSIECTVTREFAWNFWTDVSSWKLDTDIDSIEFNGSFAAGTRGVTISRSSGRIEWWIVTVNGEREAVLEIPMPDVSILFRWRFEDLGQRTRVTQRISITGEKSVSLAELMAGTFESGAPAGMKKLCETMESVAASGLRPSAR